MSWPFGFLIFCFSSAFISTTSKSSIGFYFFVLRFGVGSCGKLSPPLHSLHSSGRLVAKLMAESSHFRLLLLMLQLLLRVMGPIAVLFIQSSISLDIQLFGHVDGQVVCVFASPALLLAEHEAPSSISGERACV